MINEFSNQNRAWLLNLIAFLSAFLLFQIELIIAKILLPNYGGSYLVWGASIVFFQAALLVGYLYSHFMIQKFGVTRCLKIHFIFLFLPLLAFPGQDLVVSYTKNQLPMSLDVFVKLSQTIGLAFFVLATMSIILQSWLSQSKLPQRGNPYYLYSISNLGSFTALLSYPFLFEFYLPLSIQVDLWRLGYLILLAFYSLSFFLIKTKTLELDKEEVSDKPSLSQMLRWFLLGAGGVMVFLAVNNLITSEIAPLPLLWVFPLSIYLLAFVLNFKKKCWCPRWIVSKIYFTLVFSVLFYFFSLLGIMSNIVELVVFCFFLFLLCMYCQNQLIVAKPKSDRNLTLFYAIISLGSFLGGVVTTWVIPLISISYVEYLAGLIVIVLTMFVGKKLPSIKKWEIVLMIIAALAIAYFMAEGFKSTVSSILLIIGVVCISAYFVFRSGMVFLVFLGVILCSSPLIEHQMGRNFYIHRHRNYYGLYRVFETRQLRGLYHGTTLHGAHSLLKGMELEPTAYYTRSSPVGNIVESDHFNFKRLGLVGLGVGTLSVYFDETQTVDYYELDPEILDIAATYFKFLENSKAVINYTFGDARLSLNNYKDEKYDVFIVDAFGGDSVPMHLLTKECMQLYKKLLTDKGMIVIHISNRYLILEPVVASTAHTLDAKVCFKEGEKSLLGDQSTWMVITWDEEYFQKLTKDLKWSVIAPSMVERYRPWTDDYSSVLQIINTGAIVKSFKKILP